MSRRNCIAFKGDLRELGVGLVEGGLEIGRYGGDGEDAAAGGDELAVFDGGAGVEDDYVFGLTCLQTGGRRWACREVYLPG